MQDAVLLHAVIVRCWKQKTFVIDAGIGCASPRN
jgi:hypothetical protein